MIARAVCTVGQVCKLSSRPAYLTLIADMGRRQKRKQPSLQKKAVPKRTCNHKTKSNPWEASCPDETYDVESIRSQCYDHGLKKYEVKWVGFEDTTFEPLADLVDATALVKEFEDKQKALDLAAKAAAKAAKDARCADCRALSTIVMR